MAYGNGGNYAQTTGSYTPADIPRVASPVTSALNQRSNELGELQDVISELERRLSSVLRPSPPTALSGKPDAPAPSQSEVLEHLGRIGGGIATASMRIRDFIERLDV